MIVHGGAGSRRARDEVPGYPREIENAVKVGVEALRSSSSLEGVQAAVEYTERRKSSARVGEAHSSAMAAR